MKSLFTTVLAIIIFTGLIGCQSGNDEFGEAGATPPDTAILNSAATPAAATPLPALPPPALTLPQTSGSLPTQAGARPLVNPAHGLPYHDCSIEVGAPLANSGNNGQQQMPALTPTLPNLQQTPPGVKLNPAHGKPGHRCEIAVGAPLS